MDPEEQYSQIRDILHGGLDGKRVHIRGWVFRTRGSNKFRFVSLRDTTGIIQITFSREDAGEDIFELVKHTQVESSVLISGDISVDERAPGGRELQGHSFEVVGLSEGFPITRDQSEEFLRDMRHLWLRSRRITSILKIRSTVVGAIHEFFRKRDFVEFDPPIFTPNACEGGSTLFSVGYYDKKVYLTQSWQLYAEAAVFALGKIYDVSPTFRAERSKTSRHLTEFWMAEMEAAWMNYHDVIAIAEEEIKFILQAVLGENQEELELLEAEPSRLENSLETPWPVITYTEALERLKAEAGMEIHWGKDLRTIEEERLMEFYDTPVTVIQYPKEVMAFYKPVDDSAEAPGPVAKCFDVLAPQGYGEIIGGSERDTDLEKLTESLEGEGESIENYSWYLDLRRYGSVPHSGYGVGVERLISWICKLDNIKDAIAFPRTPARFRP